MPGILGTLLTILIVAGLVALAVRSLWRKRRSGGCSCGCSEKCGGCALRGSCKAEPPEK